MDGNDSDVGHENLIALAEASQRGGSPRLLHSPKRMVMIHSIVLLFCWLHALKVAIKFYFFG